MKLPSTLKIISENAFFGCKGLKAIRIPENVTEIGRGAFLHCIELKEAVILTHGNIPDDCFHCCHNLKTVSIPFVTGRIGQCAFKGTGLKRIMIPSTVRTVDTMAFEETALEEISIPEGIDTLGNSVFSNCHQLRTLELTCSIPHMGTDIFANCENLERVILPEEMDTIPEGMFIMCESLKEVHLPSTLKTIGRRSFAGCKSLPEITIPMSVDSIEGAAFVTCDSLETVIMNDISFSVKELLHKNYMYDAFNVLYAVHACMKQHSLYHDEQKYTIWEYMFRQYLQRPEEKALENYIHQHFEQMFQSLIISKNTELIQEYLKREEFFTEENIQKFILFANKQQAYEIQVMFSEYQRKHFALKSIAETIQSKFEL